MVDRQALESLRDAAGPANCGAHGSRRLPNTKEKLLAVLRQKPGTCLEVFRLPTRFRFDSDSSSNRITVAFFPTQAEGNRVPQLLHRVMQNAQLRRVSVF